MRFFLPSLLFINCLFTAVADEGAELFESKIRPILVESCYSCHSHQSEKVKGGLYLDSKSGWEKGGDSGQAIVPGKPKESLLFKAIQYADENLQMPPKGKKLTEAQIADFEKWIALGAHDPRVEVVKKTRSVDEVRKSHWAFQPVKRSTVPQVKNKRWVWNPIDAYLLQKMEEQKLKPAPDADRRTLLRRAAFDLTGLPPSMESVNEFLGDRSAEAFARQVERLLGSPQYGERWGRHWLDIARYADTKGDTPGGDPIFPYAYSYRDYVIRAFNEDLPYDRFLKEQLAADLMIAGDDKRSLAALGFITVGRRFLNNIHDTIDDRIDVVTQGAMGLTVACARCHDHKYDPIPTKDYYSLYGVFASSYEPEPALFGPPSDPIAHQAYLDARKKLQEDLNSFRSTKSLETQKEYRKTLGNYLLYTWEASKLPSRDKQETFVREKKLNPSGVQKWKNFLEKEETKNDPIFKPWFSYAALAEAEFAAKAPVLLTEMARGELEAVKINSLLTRELTEKPPQNLSDVAQVYGKLFQQVEEQWQAALTRNGGAAQLEDPAAEAWRQHLYGSSAPGNISSQVDAFFDLATLTRIRQLSENFDRLESSHPGAPARAMVLADGTPSDPYVFVRGNPSNRGSKVQRQFLEILSPGERKPFAKGSGRLELAEAIVSRDNPLTARVMANRVWMHHFGKPIVGTPGDFGLRSDPPTHPELLDYLAAYFMDHGWSVKQLHRHIISSHAYQLASFDPVSEKKDPDNKWFSRMTRRRLDFESMRDTLLSVSGALEPAMGGKPVQITRIPFPKRRTVYAFVDRQELPGLFRTFDFANPDTTTPQRYDTTVPQQSLFLLNSPFVTEQARGVVARIPGDSPSERRVQQLYETIFQRTPSKQEMAWAQSFISKASTLPPPTPNAPLWSYGFGEVDETAGRTKTFFPLTFRASDQGYVGGNPPPPKLGAAFLNAIGGHVGHDAEHAVIRRWIAPQNGTIRITTEFSSQYEQSTGIQGRIVSSSAGVLGKWVVANKKETKARVPFTQVKKGDTIDFVCDSMGDPSWDVFHWNIKIRYLGGEKGRASSGVEYDSLKDYAAPASQAVPLNAWEQFAQVLLLSNELMFVD